MNLFKYFILLAILVASVAQAGDPLSDKDRENLLAAIEVGRVAVEAKGKPFSAVIAGPDGSILMTQDSLNFRAIDYTKHAESVLASRFCQAYYKSAEFRKGSTLYSIAEPCAMCMFTMFSAGIGRVVYALSADHLYEEFDRLGKWPRIYLSSREAAGYMNSPMIVAGPYLEDEAAAIVKRSIELSKTRIEKTLENSIK